MKVLKTIKSSAYWYLAWVLVLVCFPIPLLAQSYYAENGTANFTSSVPLYEFTGTSKQLTGLINFTDNSVDFYLDLETLDSGIKKRDKDMRLTLETKKFPFAEYYGSLLDSVDLTNLSPQTIRTRGNFSIHGVTREIDVEGEINFDPNDIQLKATS